MATITISPITIVQPETIPKEVVPIVPIAIIKPSPPAIVQPQTSAAPRNVTPEPSPNKTYEGDAIDTEGPISLSGHWETIDFESPLELLMSVDSQMNAGLVTPHRWQIETLEDLAKCKPTSQHPHRFALCAANGSGKDAYVIAPFVVWFALTKKRSLTVITSSSGVQLTAQTENYIASMCHAVNTLFQERVFKINRRFIKCLKSGSEIRMFATDEAGKAEGYHPLEPNAEMAIIVNEAKTVSPDIFGALTRCTGYNYWLNVSTPGEPYGDFYDAFCNWPNKRRVNAFDCPHLSADHIAETARKYGEQSAIYRSQILALFTAIGGQVVIPQDFLNACIEAGMKKQVVWVKGKKRKIGVDFAAGGDECVFLCVDGNKILEIECFTQRDTTITEERLEKFLNKYGVYPNQKKDQQVDIFADDGGLGHAILDRMIKRGYSINRVLNQTRAYDHRQFGNHGAEMWYNIKRLVEEKLLILELDTIKSSDDKKLYEQLAYRHFKKNETSGKITLESKEEARANGHVSPDRADALALALSDTTLDTIQKALKDSDKKESGMTLDQIRDFKYLQYRNTILHSGDKKALVRGNSLEALFASKGIH